MKILQKSKFTAIILGLSVIFIGLSTPVSFAQSIAEQLQDRYESIVSAAEDADRKHLEYVSVGWFRHHLQLHG